METETTHPLELDFGTEAILGRLSVIGKRGLIEVTEMPAGIARGEARTALLVAVLDGRISIPDEAAVAVDLVSANPRVA